VTTSNDIGERIRLLRLQQGLSQEQLALSANMNTSYLGQLERGSKNPTLPTLDKIARGLNLTLQDLITGQSNQDTLTPKAQQYLTLLTRDEIKQLVVEAINESCPQAIKLKNK